MKKTNFHCPGCGTKNVKRHLHCNGVWHEKYECLTCGCEFFMPYIKMKQTILKDVSKKKSNLL